MKNNPWLAWTDQFEAGSATLIFGFVLLLFHALVVAMQSWLITDYALPPIGPERRFWLASLIGNTLMQGAALGSLLYLQRAFRNDIREITQTGDVPFTTRGSYLIECGVGIVFGYIINLAAANTIGGDNQAGNFYQPDSMFFSLDFLVHTQGMLIVHFLAEIYRQGSRLALVAQSTEVDLLRARDYAVFANPMLRSLGICVITAAIASPGLLFEGAAEVIVQMVIPYLVIALAVFAYPLTRGLLTIEKKLRTAKNNELKLIEDAMQGDREALLSTGLARLREIDPQINLLAYEQKIAATWTLPVSTYMRNIVLFAFLPVFTWVLAALVELLVEGAMN